MANIVDQLRNETRQTSTNLKRRRSLGIYYTPAALTNAIAYWAVRNGKDTILEPSFGGCAFLAAARQRLLTLKVKRPGNQLAGCDIDQSAFTILHSIAGKQPSPLRYLKRDFLSVEPSNFPIAEFTCVLGNPPFVRHNEISKSVKRSITRLALRTADSLPRTAGLWAHFVSHSQHFLAENGRLGLVLPGSFLFADYARPLRESLRRNFTGPLNTCIAACLATPKETHLGHDRDRNAWWGYELTDLQLVLPAQRHFRPRKAQTEGLSANLCVTVEEYVPRIVSEVGQSFALARKVSVDFYFDSLVELGNGEVHELRTAWHMDTHTYEGGRDAHPLFHFQFGGERLDGIDESIRAILIPEAPRLAIVPMDAVLAVDFVLSHYFGVLWRGLRDSEPRYGRLVRAATKRYWTEYFAHLAAFMADPENADANHPATKLFPNLI